MRRTKNGHVVEDEEGDEAENHYCCGDKIICHVGQPHRKGQCRKTTAKNAEKEKSDQLTDRQTNQTDGPIAMID